MKIAISGGSGFVGTELTEELMNQNHELFILTRNPDRKSSSNSLQYVHWLADGTKPEEILEGIDVFINLAGESLNSGRWTDERKQGIIESRVQSVKEMGRILSVVDKKPEIVINASAIGFYGTSESMEFTENSASIGNDFLARTVTRWEQEANMLKPFTSRLVLARFGVILGKKEGALPRIAMPYKLFAGGKIGSGRQWMSWIHIEDVVRALLFCIHQNEIHGPVNFVAPTPIQMDCFGKTVAQVLQRPHWFPVPSFILKMVLGEMSMLILEGQKVLPEKLISQGFTFSYPNLKPALQDLLQ
ncbi:TIGR01777 family oxidoreductase [Bacillus sp. V5-8f]|uniref:TIGR01777 family oxidoreductase n=1 Tax=Bacillus sp. V5-8f TaxID=2053044 RepID=UPI000C77CC83|nr:TIGR01777 family oxidoreductase [Bacillus sp. V5-8f]PLT33005.1 TIGR01777 family protein [Bacillus sp. V5-8f]